MSIQDLPEDIERHLLSILEPRDRHRFLLSSKTLWKKYHTRFPCPLLPSILSHNIVDVDSCWRYILKTLRQIVPTLHDEFPLMSVGLVDSPKHGNACMFIPCGNIPNLRYLPSFTFVKTASRQYAYAEPALRIQHRYYHTDYTLGPIYQAPEDVYEERVQRYQNELRAAWHLFMAMMSSIHVRFHEYTKLFPDRCFHIEQDKCLYTKSITYDAGGKPHVCERVQFNHVIYYNKDLWIRCIDSETHQVLWEVRPHKITLHSTHLSVQEQRNIIQVCFYAFGKITMQTVYQDQSLCTLPYDISITAFPETTCKGWWQVEHGVIHFTC